MNRLGLVVIRVILNPVVFVSIFGPLLVVIALRLTREVLKYSSNSDSILLKLFDHPSLPGLVDFSIQFYTTLLVLVFWIRSCYHFKLFHGLIGIIDALHHKQSIPRHILDKLWFITSAAFLVFPITPFLLVYAMTPDTLQLYIDHARRLGDLSFPPVCSPLSWERLFVILHGIALMFSKRLNES